MSGFNPHIPALPRATRDELLDRFAPTALRRPTPVAKPLNPFRLTLLAVATAGWMPALGLSSRMQRVSRMQERQLDLAVDMLSRWAGADDIAELRRTFARSDQPGPAGTAARLCLLGSFILGMLYLSRHHWSHAVVAHWWLHSFPTSDPIMTLAFGLLIATYALQWVRINQDIMTMQRFALVFNALELPHVQPLRKPKLVFGLRPIYVVIGLAFAWFGLLWGLPLMLAWGAFVTYTTDRSYVFRVALADRLQQLSGVEPVIPTTDLCPDPACRSAHAIDAIYCPRCGRELAHPMKEVS
ncbi:MAG: hypothetical protein ACTHLN_07235 [Tepidisphaeraceae bacterium]